jgi:hypothetical protein
MIVVPFLLMIADNVELGAGFAMSQRKRCLALGI